eukprot:3081449-Rhodomonas_salina.1
MNGQSSSFGTEGQSDDVVKKSMFIAKTNSSDPSWRNEGAVAEVRAVTSAEILAKFGSDAL